MKCGNGVFDEDTGPSLENRSLCVSIFKIETVMSNHNHLFDNNLLTQRMQNFCDMKSKIKKIWC